MSGRETHTRNRSALLRGKEKDTKKKRERSCMRDKGLHFTLKLVECLQSTISENEKTYTFWLPGFFASSLSLFLWLFRVWSQPVFAYSSSSPLTLFSFFSLSLPSFVSPSFRARLSHEQWVHRDGAETSKNSIHAAPNSRTRKRISFQSILNTSTAN